MSRKVEDIGSVPSAPGARERVLGALPVRAAAAVGALAALLYLPSVFNGFAVDDLALIYHDPRVRSLGYVVRAFVEPYWRGGEAMAIYRPLTSASFALDWFVSHQLPISHGFAAWFHLVNVVWNATACALLLLLLAELFPPAAALLGALLFAVHPVHTEAVANVVGRAELMSATFSFAALLLWLRAGSRFGAVRLAAMAAAYALALLSKESAATLPALLVLADAARSASGRDRSKLRGYFARRWLPLAGLAVVLALWLVVRHAVVGRASPVFVESVFTVADSTADRVRTALTAWPVYLRLLFFPRVLLADYAPLVSVPALSWTPAAICGLVLLGGCLLAGLTALATRRARAALGFFWFPITILPVSNLFFPTGVFVAERTLYTPSVALTIGAAGLTAAALRVRRRGIQPGLAAAALLLLLPLSARTLVREPEWRSTERVIAALERDAPESFRVHWNIAARARLAGNKTEAAAQFARSIELWPHSTRVFVLAARNALELGWRDSARVLASRAQAQWPASTLVRAVLEAVDSAERVARPPDAAPVLPTDHLGSGPERDRASRRQAPSNAAP